VGSGRVWMGGGGGLQYGYLYVLTSQLFVRWFYMQIPSIKI
jgi:hypothetical protein